MLLWERQLARRYLLEDYIWKSPLLLCTKTSWMKYRFFYNLLARIQILILRVLSQAWDENIGFLSYNLHQISASIDLAHEQFYLF